MSDSLREVLQERKTNDAGRVFLFLPEYESAIMQALGHTELAVTLRGERMYYFADKLMNIVLPRVRDFRGVSDTSFDGRGNYAMGVREQLIFPEINYDDVDKVRGMNIVFVTSAQTDEEARELLALLGMPFVQD